MLASLVQCLGADLGVTNWGKALRVEMNIL